MSHLLVIATLVLPIAPALNCPHRAERAEFAVRHEIYGEVGRHVIDFACDGDDLVVETTIEGEVKLLMVPLFKRDGDQRLLHEDHGLGSAPHAVTKSSGSTSPGANSTSSGRAVVPPTSLIAWQATQALLTNSARPRAASAPP